MPSPAFWLSHHCDDSWGTLRRSCRRAALLIILVNGLLLIANLFVAAALAAEGDPELNIAVRDRMHSDYDPVGLPVGSFNLFPSLELGAIYDDNIFAGPDNEQSDEIVSIRPDLVLKSNWPSDALNLHASADLLRYAHHTSENTEDYDAGFDGRYDIDQAFYLTGLFDYALRTQARTATDVAIALARPLRYQLTHFDLSASKTFNALRISGDVDRNELNYRDNADAQGVPISEQALNRAIWIFTGRASYLFNPVDSIFLQMTYNDHVFALNDPNLGNRDSHGYEITLGTEFNLTNLIRSSVQAGYLRQLFEGVPDTSQPAVHGRLEWFVTGLTTVTFDIDRRFYDSDNVGTLGYVSLAGGARIDHELYRNIIVTLEGGYEQNQYSLPSRGDGLWNVGARATWLVDRALKVEFDCHHRERSSLAFASGTAFSDDRISLSLIVQSALPWS